MCYAYREVPQEEYARWAPKFLSAFLATERREDAIDKVADMVEKDLILLGATGVEDELHHQVPTAVTSLISGGMRLWMLTGDNSDAAISTGLSCGLLNDRINLMIFTRKVQAEKPNMVRMVLESGPTVLAGSGDSYALVIDGDSLSAILKGDLDGASFAAVARERGGSHHHGNVTSTAMLARSQMLAHLKSSASHNGKGALTPTGAMGGNGFSRGLASLSPANSGNNRAPPGKERQWLQHKKWHEDWSRRQEEFGIEAWGENAVGGGGGGGGGGGIGGRSMSPSRLASRKASSRKGVQRTPRSREWVIDRFLTVCTMCRAVICCRLTPTQKATLVQLLRERRKFVVLAIGDGLNDVNMLSAANVGVGISGGVEGFSASNAGDYSLPLFGALPRLLLVHGRWCQRRILFLVLYSLYKNAAFVTPALLLAFLSGFSSMQMFPTALLSTYNVLWTSLPSIANALLERDAEAETLLRLPQLYHDTMDYSLASLAADTLLWLLTGLWHATVVVVVVSWGLGSVGVVESDNGRIQNSYCEIGTATFIILVWVVNLKCALHTRRWTLIQHALLWGWSMGMPVLYTIALSNPGKRSDKPMNAAQSFVFVADVCPSVLYSGEFYACALLASTAALLPDILALAAAHVDKTGIFTRNIDIIQEVEAGWCNGTRVAGKKNRGRKGAGILACVPGAVNPMADDDGEGGHKGGGGLGAPGRRGKHRSTIKVSSTWRGYPHHQNMPAPSEPTSPLMDHSWHVVGTSAEGGMHARAGGAGPGTLGPGPHGRRVSDPSQPPPGLVVIGGHAPPPLAQEDPTFTGREEDYVSPHDPDASSPPPQDVWQGSSRVGGAAAEAERISGSFVWGAATGGMGLVTSPGRQSVVGSVTGAGTAVDRSRDPTRAFLTQTSLGAPQGMTSPGPSGAGAPGVLGGGVTRGHSHTQSLPALPTMMVTSSVGGVGGPGAYPSPSTTATSGFGQPSPLSDTPGFSSQGSRMTLSHMAGAMGDMSGTGAAQGAMGGAVPLLERALVSFAEGAGSGGGGGGLYTGGLSSGMASGTTFASARIDEEAIWHDPDFAAPGYSSRSNDPPYGSSGRDAVTSTDHSGDGYAGWVFPDMAAMPGRRARNSPAALLSMGLACGLAAGDSVPDGPRGDAPAASSRTMEASPGTSRSSLSTKMPPGGPATTPIPIGKKGHATYNGAGDAMMGTERFTQPGDAKFSVGDAKFSAGDAKFSAHYTFGARDAKGRPRGGVTREPSGGTIRLQASGFDSYDAAGMDAGMDGVPEAPQPQKLPQFLRSMDGNGNQDGGGDGIAPAGAISQGNPFRAPSAGPGLAPDPNQAQLSSMHASLGNQSYTKAQAALAPHDAAAAAGDNSTWEAERAVAPPGSLPPGGLEPGGLLISSGPGGGPSGLAKNSDGGGDAWPVGNGYDASHIFSSAPLGLEVGGYDMRGGGVYAAGGLAPCVSPNRQLLPPLQELSEGLAALSPVGPLSPVLLQPRLSLGYRSMGHGERTTTTKTGVGELTTTTTTTTTGLGESTTVNGSRQLAHESDPSFSQPSGSLQVVDGGKDPRGGGSSSTSGISRGSAALLPAGTHAPSASSGDGGRGQVTGEGPPFATMSGIETNAAGRGPAESSASPDNPSGAAAGGVVAAGTVTSASSMARAHTTPAKPLQGTAPSKQGKPSGQGRGGGSRAAMTGYDARAENSNAIGAGAIRSEPVPPQGGTGRGGRPLSSTRVKRRLIFDAGGSRDPARAFADSPYSEVKPAPTQGSGGAVGQSQRGGRGVPDSGPGSAGGTFLKAGDSQQYSMTGAGLQPSPGGHAGPRGAQLLYAGDESGARFTLPDILEPAPRVQDNPPLGAYSVQGNPPLGGYSVQGNPSLGGYSMQGNPSLGGYSMPVREAPDELLGSSGGLPGNAQQRQRHPLRRQLTTGAPRAETVHRYAPREPGASAGRGRSQSIDVGANPGGANVLGLSKVEELATSSVPRRLSLEQVQ
eukprot:jgi/Mesvir1/12260/Mv00475-RA.1